MHFQFVILHAGKERENTVGSGNKQQSWNLGSIFDLIMPQNSLPSLKNLYLSKNTTKKSQRVDVQYQSHNILSALGAKPKRSDNVC